MQTGRGRALLACLEPARAAALTALLDEAGFDTSAVASDTPSALRLLRQSRIDLMLSDAILPGGDGVSLAEAIVRAPLERHPDVLLICPAGLRLPGESKLAALGAAMLDEPLTVDALNRALDVLHARASALPPEKAAALNRLLDRLGVPRHIGRDMLIQAVALAWRDRRRVYNLKEGIYPGAALPFGKTPVQAERAIRHVIEAAWRTGAMDEQQRIFGDTIDARRGHPTCGEMIAQLADILRWEG